MHNALCMGGVLASWHVKVGPVENPEGLPENKGIECCHLPDLRAHLITGDKPHRRAAPRYGEEIA